jgi:hypothetical protein
MNKYLVAMESGGGFSGISNFGIVIAKNIEEAQNKACMLFGYNKFYKSEIVVFLFDVLDDGFSFYK